MISIPAHVFILHGESLYSFPVLSSLQLMHTNNLSDHPFSFWTSKASFQLLWLFIDRIHTQRQCVDWSCLLAGGVSLIKCVRSGSVTVMTMIALLEETVAPPFPCCSSVSLSFSRFKSFLLFSRAWCSHVWAHFSLSTGRTCQYFVCGQSSILQRALCRLKLGFRVKV